MAKVGRNDTCPCGSGKKYKKCCLPAHEKQQAASRVPAMATEAGASFFDDLDELSNSVLDLVDARRFDEALDVCDRLRRDYPEVADGLERAGLVYAAMGEHAKAAQFYRQAYDFVCAPVRRADYDEEGIEQYREDAEREEALAQAAADKSAPAAEIKRAP